MLSHLLFTLNGKLFSVAEFETELLWFSVRLELVVTFVLPTEDNTCNGGLFNDVSSCGNTKSAENTGKLFSFLVLKDSTHAVSLTESWLFDSEYKSRLISVTGKSVSVPFLEGLLFCIAAMSLIISFEIRLAEAGGTTLEMVDGDDVTVLAHVACVTDVTVTVLPDVTCVIDGNDTLLDFTSVTGGEVTVLLDVTCNTDVKGADAIVVTCVTAAQLLLSDTV